MTGNPDRATSTALTHTLTLAITAVLISTLLIGAGQLLQNQRERVAHEQFSEIGNNIVTQIDEIDDLDQTGKNVTVRVQPSYPERVVGEPYQLNITDDDDQFPFETDYALEIQSPVLEQPIQYPLETNAELNETANTQGGSILICLTDGEIDIGSNCS